MSKDKNKTKKATRIDGETNFDLARPSWINHNPNLPIFRNPLPPPPPKQKPPCDKKDK